MASTLDHITGRRGVLSFEGTRHFGPAYHAMFQNDPHAPDSIDRWLLDRMVLLCSETAPYLYSVYTPTNILCARGVRPALEAVMAAAMAPAPGDVVGGVLRLCRSVIDKADPALDTMRFGGTEEQIICRGSSWSWDLARVAVASCQIRNMPARMVVLADPAKPYHAHAIAEVYRDGAWGAVDPTAAIVYEHSNGKPASVWSLVQDERLVETHARCNPTPFAFRGQFRCAAIVNYHVFQSQADELPTTRLNAYYRTILEMNDRGWPGGLRWLHGEDDASPRRPHCGACGIRA